MSTYKTAADVRPQTFEAYPIGLFHIDSTEVRTEERRLRLFVAIDRTFPPKDDMGRCRAWRPWSGR